MSSRSSRIAMGGLAALALLIGAGVQGAENAPDQQKKAEVKMERRRITVSVIGSDLPELPPGETPTAERVIAYWAKEMASEWGNRPDLMVLPELCDVFRGMTKTQMRDYLKTRGDRVLDFFRATAKEHRCYLIYGAYRDLPGGGYANCSYLIGRDGEIVGIYDKNYPTIGDMEFGTRPGAEAPVFETDFGTIGMIICFDLNFDELLERYAAKKPDILAFSSYYHGGLMQGYWAYRCRAHFLGAAVGALESTVVSPVGEVLKKSTCYFRKFTTSINTNCAVVHLDGNWAKLQAAIDRYGTDITMSDPGNLGAVLLTVERPGLKVEAVLREFSIERWDDYYQRSAAAREQALQQQPK